MLQRVYNVFRASCVVSNTAIASFRIIPRYWGWWRVPAGHVLVLVDEHVCMYFIACRDGMINEDLGF